MGSELGEREGERKKKGFQIEVQQEPHLRKKDIQSLYESASLRKAKFAEKLKERVVS